MNGEVCCILGVCCPAGSQAQQDALEKELVKDGICAKSEAPRYAGWLLQNFDLAPVGSLTKLKAEIAKLAKHAP